MGIISNGKTILTACAFLLASVTLSYTGEWKPGDRKEAYAFCSNELSAKKLSSAFKKDGPEGYLRVVTDLKIDCIDTRLSPLPYPVYMILLEPKWVFQSKAGRYYRMWTFIWNNEIGWIWVPENSEPA